MSSAAVTTAIEHILRPIGRRIDRTNPTVDARLPDGSRVCAVIEPVAVDGPCLTIRRFAMRPLPLAAFAAPTTSSRCCTTSSRARCNLLVSGATSSGKTTLLNALAALVPTTERIITLEDIAELRLPHPHVVRLETRPASAEGAGEITLAATAANRAANAPRPAGARRGPRGGGRAAGASDEHRSRRFDVDGARQLGRRRDRPRCARWCCRRFPAGRSRPFTTRFADPSMS